MQDNVDWNFDVASTSCKVFSQKYLLPAIILGPKHFVYQIIFSDQKLFQPKQLENERYSVPSFQALPLYFTVNCGIYHYIGKTMHTAYVSRNQNHNKKYTQLIAVHHRVRKKKVFALKGAPLCFRKISRLFQASFERCFKSFLVFF